MYQRIIFAYSLILLTSLVHGAANDIVAKNIEQLPAWIAAEMKQRKHAASPQGEGNSRKKALCILAMHRPNNNSMMTQEERAQESNKLAVDE